MLWSWAEKQFVFFPEPVVASTPAQAGLSYEDVYLTAPDGLKLHGWFLPAPEGRNKDTQTWLWFHGNGGNLGTRVGQLERRIGYWESISSFLTTGATGTAKEDPPSEALTWTHVAQSTTSSSGRT